MEHMLIIATTVKENDICLKLCELITDMDCFVSQAQGVRLGKEFAFTVLTTGNWNNIAKLETACTKLSDKITTIFTKRTERSVPEIQCIPYTLQIIGVDQVGLIYNVCRFLKERGASIENVDAQTYLSNYSSTPMLTLTISMCLPISNSIAEVREQFAIFCEDLNIDGVLEPDTK